MGWDELKDFIKFLVIGIVVLGSATMVFLIGVQGLSLAFFDNVRMSVLVDGKTVFKGLSGCVQVKSTGATTRVDVGGGFLCLFPQAYYVSKDVKIINE